MEKQVIETFNPNISPRDMKDFQNPSSINWVSIKKYRVTIEEIKEPIEVYQERLQYLLDKTTNHYEAQNIRAYAKKIGVTLKVK